MHNFCKLVAAGLLVTSLAAGRDATAADVTLSLGEGVMVGQSVDFPVNALFTPDVPGTEVIGFNLDVAGSNGTTLGTTDLDGPTDDDFSRFSFVLDPGLAALGWIALADFNEPLTPSLAEISDDFTGGVTDSTIAVGKIIVSKAGLAPGTYAVRIDGPLTTADLLVPDPQSPSFPQFVREETGFEVAFREFTVPIPEPASAAALGMVGLLMAGRRRRG